MRTSSSFIFSFLFYFQLVEIVFAQIDRTQQSQNIKDLNPYIVNASTVTTTFSFERIGNNKNVALSSFFISGNEISNVGLTPVLVGNIRVSWNLDLIGRMSAHSNKENALNIYGWGLVYKPGKEETISPWTFGINSGVYRSYNTNRSSSLSLSILRSVSINNYGFALGVSTNNVKGINYNFEQKSDSQNFQYTFSNVIIGTTINLMGIKLLPSYIYNSNQSMVSFGLQKEF